MINGNNYEKNFCTNIIFSPTFVEAFRQTIQDVYDDHHEDDLILCKCSAHAVI
jgi:hypothetical protein